MAIEPSNQSSENRNNGLSRGISITIILCAAVTGLIALRQVAVDPRTDDAEIFANFIGIAPLISGPITELHVVDNQFVKQGDPLFEIDDRPYAYALARAKSDQQALEGEIGDERRIIAGKVSGVDVAKAAALSSEASLNQYSWSTRGFQPLLVTTLRTAVALLLMQLQYVGGNSPGCERLAESFQALTSSTASKTRL